MRSGKRACYARAASLVLIAFARWSYSSAAPAASEPVNHHAPPSRISVAACSAAWAFLLALERAVPAAEAHLAVQ